MEIMKLIRDRLLLINKEIFRGIIVEDKDLSKGNSSREIKGTKDLLTLTLCFQTTWMLIGIFKMCLVLLPLNNNKEETLGGDLERLRKWSNLMIHLGWDRIHLIKPGREIREIGGTNCELVT